MIRVAAAQALPLLLATVALIMPVIFKLVQGPGLPGPIAGVAVGMMSEILVGSITKRPRRPDSRRSSSA